ncbi:nuclear transcription factor Y subunit A-1-like [Olea europaea subsp. europaea]|uniref:Nuclear transcription factor Y subunit n=1 Tax=Olea europaea subsp. europaea TaxID=158383 RepID=A0A8S0V9J0_OLEEU|nr:nuclear transcription factor Y subunit A-1-like [Olea europaea subsp. europaea]
MQDNDSDCSSLEQSTDSKAQSESCINKEDNATKQSEDSNSGWGGQNFQQYSSTIHPSGDSLTQPPHLELVGHFIACAMNPYDPYGGMMAAYGQPSKIKKIIVIVPLIGFLLYTICMSKDDAPMEMALEPVYVNAKQYHGTLRRRQSRAKAVLGKKLINPYLHESRHQHALRRARGSGGRLVKKSDADTSKETCSASTVSSQSFTSSNSELLPSESSEAKVHSCNNDVSSSRKQINLYESSVSVPFRQERGRTHFRSVVEKYPIKLCTCHADAVSFHG